MLLRLVKIVLIATLLYNYVAIVPSVFAASNSFATIVNPVRGGEFWGLSDQQPQDAVISQYKLINGNGLVATWLLRFDALENSQIMQFFQEIDKSQESGIFLEITPSLARTAGVPYKEKGVFWHDADRVFLSGYKIEDRKKLIDAVFDAFLGKFGFYPKSVGAWHVDAHSASYMSEKYGISGVLICADQFSTDNYQIWGGWWGAPYYPSALNILMPAQTPKNKIDTVIFWWAARDPDLAYAGSSGFSVQANDYTAHDLGTDYFRKLLDIYLQNKENKFNQITIGIENDYSLKIYGKEYQAQIEEVKKREGNGEIKVLTMKEFSRWYRQEFKEISPSHVIGRWMMTPQYRVSLIEKGGKKYIRDLRIYNEKWPESNFLTANPWESLSLNNPYKIDSLRFSNQLKEVNDLNNTRNIIKEFGTQNIPFEANNFFLSFFYLFCFLGLIRLFNKNFSVLAILIVGSLGLSLTMIKSGLIYPFGMGFWGPNGHDGIWHIALINQLAQGRLSHPTFANFNLLNYHFGFDLLAALIHKVTTIPVINLYFQVLPVIFSLLTGILVYSLVKRWIKSESAALLSTFFVYFGGSWGWVIDWLKNKSFGGESVFWANQAVSSLINPPYALSIIVLLGSLILFLEYLEKPTQKRLLALSLLFGVLIQIKVYAGVIVLGSLGVLGVIGIMREKNGTVLRLFLGSAAVSLLVFLPFNRGAGSLIILSPLWFPHTMLAFGDRLGWIRLENARQAYLATDQWVKWVLAEGLALLIFILGNLGTRVLGFGWLISRCRGDRGDRDYEGNKGKIAVLLVLILLISLTLTLALVQKGNPWNTIQFFYYFQFFMGILTGVWLARFLVLLKNKLVKLGLLVILVILTVPTALGTLFYNYLPSRPPARISFEELEALDFLKQQSEGVVLTYPHESSWREKFTEPKPLYAYETTAYVSAFSGMQTFLEDEMNLEISGYDWRPKREREIRFYAIDNKEWAKSFLRDNKIKYIYLVKGQKMNLGLGDINAEKIFENGEVVIFNLVENK
ncbi:hypothetical protein FJZ40_01620 [Candidatus Shapirobacteria bacterium]|nr:hypothetical protein [Candidatus Shapirobacteria bacterium]